MFFRRRRAVFSRKADSAGLSSADLRDALEGTTPEVVEAQEAESEEKASETASLTLAEAAPNEGETLPATPSDEIRLFPGFERDDFEVGYRSDKDNPSLVIRWKDGGEWFPVPALFNRGILAAMDERDSASDLNRLLRNYGYDVDAVNRD